MVMMGIESLKPGVFAGSILYALLGVAVFWLCFVIIDKLTPYKLWEEIIEKRNMALAIVVAAMCISIGLIVSAAVHG
jgi:putative membrane protein